MGRRSLLLTPLRTTSVPNLATSLHLSSLVFVSYDSAFYTHCDHTLHHTPETQAHRNMRLRNASKDAGKAGSSHHLRSPSHSTSGLKSPPHSTAGLRSPPHSGLRSPPHSGLRSPPHSIAGGRTPLSPVSVSCVYIYFIIFYYILLYFIIFYYILLYSIIFYYILLYSIIFYYILLYSIYYLLIDDYLFLYY